MSYIFIFSGGWAGQCVVDDRSRVLDHSVQVYDLTPKRCIESCSNESYIFAGVQARSYCFCGNTVPVKSIYAPAAECNRPCKGDQDQICGGRWRMNVYTTRKLLYKLYYDCIYWLRIKIFIYLFLRCRFLFRLRGKYHI
jgi:hypothetical protein